MEEHPVNVPVKMVSIHVYRGVLDCVPLYAEVVEEAELENSNVLEDVSIRSILATINASIQTQFLSTYQNVGIFNEILIDLNNKMNKTGCYFLF